MRLSTTLCGPDAQAGVLVGRLDDQRAVLQQPLQTQLVDRIVGGEEHEGRRGNARAGQQPFGAGLVADQCQALRRRAGDRIAGQFDHAGHLGLAAADAAETFKQVEHNVAAVLPGQLARRSPATIADAPGSRRDARGQPASR